MTRLVKIYGERNTNTNHVSKLIELNLDVKELPGVVSPFIRKLTKVLPYDEFIRDTYFRLTYSNNLGWKHTCVKSIEQLNRYKILSHRPVFITITKNPYSWLLSLYRRPYHQNYADKPKSFSDFLQRPWKTLDRDNTKPLLSSPVELWNIKNASYLQFKNENVLHLTTESIIESPEDVINQISSRFAIPRLSEEFIDFKRSTKDPKKDTAYYRDYYLHEKWRDEIRQDEYKLINERLNTDLMSHFGYQLVT